MSVIAIHPRTQPPVSTRPGSGRRRGGPVVDAPTLRVTFDIPLAGEQLTPQATRLLELVRELVDRGDGTVALTGVGSQPAALPATPSPAGGLAAVSGPPAEPVDDGRAGDAGPQLRVLTGPRVVLRNGRPVPFTRLEFDLLHFLARNPRRVFTRLQLLGSVWGYEHAVARTVDVHVRRLRAKVGDAVPLVTTVYGVGYRLADDAPVRVVAEE
ncbi:winged helix-turn-helix domain-containing protein [Plantactinospora sp. CA-290183]|uniref:winged helix-turn-helix domain-containing protein n=1 Tax=Plantactinospora sp. CA-290183 TaxID=3240006 RepID=UPI003D89B590